MVGSSAAKHKFNFLDARDLDAAFRLTFSGGFVHSSTGILPNGVNGYIDTKFIMSTNLSTSAASVGFYSRTNTAILGRDISANNTAVPTNSAYVYVNLGGDYYARLASGEASYTNADSRGFYTVDKNSSNSVKSFKNGILKATIAGNVGALPDNSLLLCGAATGLFSNHELAFAYISDSCTNTDQANLYTAVQAFQTTLSRQV
jgi:hypothetical protein